MQNIDRKVKFYFNESLINNGHITQSRPVDYPIEQSILNLTSIIVRPEDNGTNKPRIHLFDTGLFKISFIKNQK